MKIVLRQWFFQSAICCGVLLLMGAATTMAAPDDYLKAPHHLPYRFENMGTFSNLDFCNRGWGRRGLLCDIDGDGIGERFNISDTGPKMNKGPLMAGENVWQDPLPVDFNHENSRMSVEGVWTFADSLGPEVVFRSSTEDRFRWLIQRRRAVDGKLIASFELKGGEDHRPDGIWDGDIKVLGVEDVINAGVSRQAMIILATVGFDLQKRGVLAVDAETGQVIWEYSMGPKPRFDQALLVDLDGDKRREIVFSTSATGNIHEGYFNGTRDDTTRVFAINPDGKLLWSWPCGPDPSDNSIIVHDLDNDGFCEVIVVSNTAVSSDNKVWLLDYKGRELAEQAVGGGADWLDLVSSSQDEVQVAMTQINGSLSMLAVSKTGIRIVRSIKGLPRTKLMGVLDCLPESGPEIFFRTGDNRIWVLNQELKPLAMLHSESFPDVNHGITRLNPGTSYSQLFAYGNEKKPGQLFELVPNPRPVPWILIMGLVVAGGLVVMIWRTRKRRPSAATRRELRLQLLERLQLSGHGAIGGLSSLRRLVWNLRTMAQGFTMQGDQKVVIGDLATDILDNQLPKLEGAVELARLVDLDGDKTGHAAGALVDLRRHLEQLNSQGTWVDAPLDEVEGLGKVGEIAEMAFQVLRSEVEVEFRVQPAEIVNQCLAAHAADLEQAQVAVSVGLDGVPDCCMDAEEMVFVVDNLVGNAVRAMAQGQHNSLGIDWKQGGNYVTIRFVDTGRGIVPEDWQRIFEAGQSTRKGGGLGLSRSREILRKFGGGLMVQESSPGGGTVMVLTLAVVGSSGP